MLGEDGSGVVRLSEIGWLISGDVIVLLGWWGLGDVGDQYL